MAVLRGRRLEAWCQTPATRLAGPVGARPLIERAGMATLFPVSPELPNLFHAYTGDPDARTSSEWDSPAGEVYTWRWLLGRREAAFYTAIVRKRPTWVSWALLPAVLRLRGETRPLAEIYAAGALSANAYRLAQALEEAGGVLSTGELRRAAGFPTGKAQRAAYLKAIEELDTRLLLAKVFSENDEEVRHALVQARYAEHTGAAARLTREKALEALLLAYLPGAAYAIPAALAKDLGLPEGELRAGLERLEATHAVQALSLPGQKGAWYVWSGTLASAQAGLA